MDKDKLLAIAAIALSNGQDIAGENEMDFAVRMGLETEYFSGASWYEIFWYYYQPPNTASTGQAASGSQSENNSTAACR